MDADTSVVHLPPTDGMLPSQAVTNVLEVAMLAAGPAAPSAGSAAAILAAAGSLAVSTWLSPTKGSTWCAPNDLLPLITRPVSGLTPKVYKQWEVYPKGVQSVFDRQNQVFTTCRHFLLTFSPIVDAYLKQVGDALPPTPHHPSPPAMQYYVALPHGNLHTTRILRGFLILGWDESPSASCALLPLGLQNIPPVISSCQTLL